MNSTLQFARKAAIPAAPLLYGALPHAHAQVVYTPDQNLTISSTTDAIYFDLDHSGAGPYASTTGFHDNDFFLCFGQPAQLTSKTVAKPQIRGGSNASGIGYIANAAGSNFVANLSLNSSVASAIALSTTTSTGNLNKPVVVSNADTGARQNDANWAPGTTGYVGLELGSGYGWVQVTYGFDQSLTLHDFAYNPGGDIAIGQTAAVPEPATYAAIAGLLAGSAALYRRRQQKKSVEAVAAA